MIRDYIKIILFLSSYSPLFLVLGIKYYLNLPLVICLGVIILLSNLILFFVVRKSSKMSGQYYELKNREDKSGQFVEYMITYIIPFLGFNLSQVTDLVSLGIIFFIIGILYVKSDLIYMNPILSLLNYKLYKIEIDMKEMMIISKEEIENSKKIRVYKITNKVGINIC